MVTVEGSGLPVSGHSNIVLITRNAPVGLGSGPASRVETAATMARGTRSGRRDGTGGPSGGGLPAERARHRRGGCGERRQDLAPASGGEARRRALHAEDRHERAVAADDRRGDRVEVGLALPLRLGPALRAHGGQLLAQAREIGDRAARCRRAARPAPAREGQQHLPGRGRVGDARATEPGHAHHARPARDEVDRDRLLAAGHRQRRGLAGPRRRARAAAPGRGSRTSSRASTRSRAPRGAAPACTGRPARARPAPPLRASRAAARRCWGSRRSGARAR